MQSGRCSSLKGCRRCALPARRLPRLLSRQGEKSSNAVIFIGRRQSVQADAAATSGGRTALRNSATFKVQLIKPSEDKKDASYDKLLVYLPGTDGTGQAILPQIPGLHGLGYDVWCLYLPPDDRSDWEQLTTQLTLLLRQLLQHWRAERHPETEAAQSIAGEGAPTQPRMTIVAESFGCCLALRLAASGAGPELIDRLVLLNPATSFNSSLSGLSSLLAGTNLLSLFPRDWYAVAQTTLLPLLVDGDRVEEANQRLLQSMVLMEPPASSQSFGFGAARPQRPAAATAAGTAAAGATDADGAAASSRSSGGGGEGTLFYVPAAAANFRANLLRSGDPGEEVLRRVAAPVLLVTSARDRLLPSIVEGARLERALPNARRYLLPDSGHAAMLERGFSLAAAMQATGFAGDTPGASSPRPQKTAAGAAGAAGHRSKARTSAVAGGSTDPSAAAAHASWTAVPDGPLAGASVTSGSEERGALATASAAASPATGAERVAAAASADAIPLSSSSSPNGYQTSEPAVATKGRRARAADGSAAKGGGGGGEEQPLPADIDSAFDEWCQKLSPWRDVVSPVVLGFEHLPPPGSPAFSRPMLFVGNHQKMGFYDTPLLVYELYVRGYRVRGLAHPGHWEGPFGRWFESFGSVKASPMAAFRLLRDSEKVLLFPGGAKEVVKKRGQEYKLLWKESPDFVRLAARCNALIVPFAAVGADDAYDVIMDTDEVIAHPVLGPLTTGLLSRVSSALEPQESIFPITRLPVVGLPTPIPIPNLQRLYFQFAPPIDPRALGTDIHDTQQVQELYDGVKATVTQCMADLLAVREADEDSQLGARLAKSLKRMVPVLGPAAAAPSAPTQQPPQ